SVYNILTFFFYDHPSSTGIYTLSLQTLFRSFQPASLYTFFTHSRTAPIAPGDRPSFTLPGHSGMDSQIPDFRSFTPAQRLEAIALKAARSAEDIRRLSQPGALPLETADGMIENVLGTFERPYAVAGHFRVNGADVLVPRAVEEPSVVAAASHMAKIARAHGGFQTSSTGPIMRAQIQVLGVSDPFGARHAILQHRQ